jgi:Ca2+-binding RTX toxin-like protein
MSGGNGDDIIFGNEDNDTVSGDAGNDILMGDEHIDTLSGDSGFDLIYGQSGADILGGLDGEADLIIGGLDADSCNAEQDDIAYECEP